MAIHKMLNWGPDVNAEGKTWCKIVYMIGYCPNTIEQYTKMAEEVIKDFPMLTVGQFVGGKVFKSIWCDNFTLVVALTYLEKKAYEGWTSFEPDHQGMMTEYWY